MVVVEVNPRQAPCLLVVWEEVEAGFSAGGAAVVIRLLLQARPIPDREVVEQAQVAVRPALEQQEAAGWSF